MIEHLDYTKVFEYENNFWWSSDPSRMKKILAHFELYKLILNVPGSIAEFGVFKGVSLIRILSFRKLLEPAKSRKVYGFDTFASFPDKSKEDDEKMYKTFLKNAGDQSIPEGELFKLLEHKGVSVDVELISGDILQTLPDFMKKHGEETFALIHIDVDIYQPTKCILENVYENLAIGGVLILDDYGVWNGETQAVDEFFEDNKHIQGFAYSDVPKYIIKK